MRLIPQCVQNPLSLTLASSAACSQCRVCRPGPRCVQVPPFPFMKGTKIQGWHSQWPLLESDNLQQTFCGVGRAAQQKEKGLKEDILSSSLIWDLSGRVIRISLLPQIHAKVDVGSRSFSVAHFLPPHPYPYSSLCPLAQNQQCFSCLLKNNSNKNRRIDIFRWNKTF